jgi:hypothetical protein
VRIRLPQLGQLATVPSTLMRHDGARQMLTAGIDFPFFDRAAVLYQTIA